MGEGPKIASGPSRVPERTNFSGTLFATTFNPQYSPETMLPLEPKDLFPPTISMMASPPAFRFINRYNTTEALIYTDGSCLDNGDAEARGGYAFYFKPVRGSDKSGLVAMKLEDKGLDGLTYRHTSNRAELRAALAALRYKSWWSEGLKSLVIATDSSYVVNSATDWARSWISKGWRTSRGEGVKNRDLWEALLLAVEMLHDHGVNVHFWHIPRKFNNEADRAAKDAALVLDACDVFGFGFMQSYDWGSTR
ncbi:ribonuclease H-like domain-containing protein [Colletotrichum phormii]|uniref:ribonuclease H n=1 Tax=Colletotrichum phormii TaxID=359342 RepID=A0AAI9ZYI6_9PEZI|nr:ribonuclease H-like domain-containing protein [Colletotrichum phormii]KAK1640140.1 ribonuclease H-like domain-containing protein [Colletotrichum phormii]